MTGTSFAFEHSVHFLSEQRTELYGWYDLGVAQLKNVMNAENTLRGQSCSGIERCGA